MTEEKNNKTEFDENAVSDETVEKETECPETEEPESKHKDSKKQLKTIKSELEKAKKENDELAARLDEANDKYLRMAAEYENFRKRSQREREAVYDDACFDTVRKLLPTIDNLERAAQYSDPEKLADGVKMILGGVPETLTSLGIEAFGEAGEEFDPNFHNAVMMVSDPEAKPGSIVNVLQRGYKRGEKVLRFAMVTVAEEA